MAKPYVDTHCHLDSIYERMKLPVDYSFDDFSSTWPEGFDGCVCVFSETLEASMRFIDSGNAKIYGALGQHPHGAIQYCDEFEAQLLEKLKHPQVRALGEIGLDYHYTLSPVEVQKRVFERQAMIAVEKQLPIVIHTREADDDTFEILKKVVPKDHIVHIHCYTGSTEWAEKVLKEWTNVYFGFTGVITFKNSQSIREACAKVPMDRVLSETDGPYMAPIPYRGKAAWPGHIPIIVAKIAELHGISQDDGFDVIRENVRKVYKF